MSGMIKTLAAGALLLSASMGTAAAQNAGEMVMMKMQCSAACNTAYMQCVAASQQVTTDPMMVMEQVKMNFMMSAECGNQNMACQASCQ